MYVRSFVYACLRICFCWYAPKFVGGVCRDASVASGAGPGDCLCVSVRVGVCVRVCTCVWACVRTCVLGCTLSLGLQGAVVPVTKLIVIDHPHLPHARPPPPPPNPTRRTKLSGEESSASSGAFTVFHDADAGSGVDVPYTAAGVASGQSLGVALAAAGPYVAVGGYMEEVRPHLMVQSMRSHV